MPARVYLVGAGPGDEGLITVRGLELLQRCDVVLYDRLASAALLHHAPAHALRIAVGKRGSEKMVAQDDIAALMIEHWRAGRNVVRLKGGDPAIYGHLPEELAPLIAAEVAFEVVPGVSTVSAAAACAGVAITRKPDLETLMLSTGHHPERINWSACAGADMLAIYMGAAKAAENAAHLMAAGRAGDTPVLFVRDVSRPGQQSFAGTLQKLPHLPAGEAPILMLVGDGVLQHQVADWMQRRPLHGVRILNTRAAGQAMELTRLLEEQGATVVSWPVIAIEDPVDAQPLQQAILRLRAWDWIVFTSANAVRRFFVALDASAQDLRQLRAKLCAIGPATSAELTRRHLKVDVVPQEYVAESLLAALPLKEMKGARVLIPRAASARDVVPEALRSIGAQVEIVEVYRTVLPRSTEPFPEAVPHWITFTSASTVKNFLALAGKPQLEDCLVASIGPVTTAALQAHGVQPTVEASPSTMEGLCDAILSFRRR
jgi:uroporphyrinogen III methyltransferase / synthase